jgi:hypothetical protein
MRDLLHDIAALTSITLFILSITLWAGIFTS